MPTQISAQRIPNTLSEKKALNPTMEIVKTILDSLGYQGAWTLVGGQRIRKKSPERFRAVRLTHHGILVRCKPGDNSTSWEYTLVPPHGLNAEEILQKLSKVHPTSLQIPGLDGPQVAVVGPSEHNNIVAKQDATSKGEPVKKIERRVSSSVEGRTKIIPLVGGLGKKYYCGFIDSKTGRPCPNEAAEAREINGKMAGVCVEHMLSPEWFSLTRKKNPALSIPIPGGDLIIDLPGVAKAQQPKAKEKSVPQNDPPKPPAKPSEHAAESEDYLNLPSGITSLCDDPQALDRALIAATFVFNANGNANRAIVTESITKELRLAVFVESSKAYGDLRSAVRAIIMGLVKHRFIQRLYYKKRKAHTVRPTTVGYIITPTGRDRVAKLMEYLPQSIAKRLWGGHDAISISDMIVSDEAVEEELYAEEDFEPQTQAEEEVMAESEAAPLDKITRNLQRLKPLLERHDQLNKGIEELNGVIAGVRADRETYELSLLGIGEKVKSLQGQIEKLQAEIAQLELRSEAVKKVLSEKDDEIQTWVSEKESQESELSQVLAEVKEIMG